MKRIALSLFFCSAILPLTAQERYKFQLDASTPEGLLLQNAGQADSDAKKIEIYEEFLQKHPTHPGATYAWAQVQPLYLNAGQLDKVLAAAEAIHKGDPFNAPAAYNGLQSAEKKKDNDGIKLWSARTVDSAKKVLALKQPEDEDDVETWKREIDYATQVITRCEYSLYVTALQATDPKVIADMSATLIERHPDSQYVPQVAGRYFLALQQTGQKDAAIAFAEQRLQKDKSNPEMIVMVADHYLQSRKSPDKVLEYSQMLVESAQAAPAPAGADPAAWEQKKKTLTGLGHWMAGSTYASQNKWADTDKSFRAALPFIAGNNDLLGPAYFYLGLANYNMSKGPKPNQALRAEARKYSELCAGIKGPYQARATTNLNAINAGK
jgi:tetratricopeptide (TPR) repeat protein